jgi:hypothetical protein
MFSCSLSTLPHWLALLPLSLALLTLRLLAVASSSGQWFVACLCRASATAFAAAWILLALAYLSVTCLLAWLCGRMACRVKNTAQQLLTCDCCEQNGTFMASNMLFVLKTLLALDVQPLKSTCECWYISFCRQLLQQKRTCALVMLTSTTAELAAAGASLLAAAGEALAAGAAAGLLLPAASTSWFTRLITYSTLFTKRRTSTKRGLCTEILSSIGCSAVPPPAGTTASPDTWHAESPRTGLAGMFRSAAWSKNTAATTL